MTIRNRAFTFIELVVVVGLIGTGLAFLPGPMNRSREAANRIKCSSNLRQIGLALKMYANMERDNSLPRTVWDPEKADKPTAYTKFDVANPFLDSAGPDANDVTAGLFLLLRTQEISPSVFVCPSSAAERFPIPAGKTVWLYSNFDGPAHLSYGMNNPYQSKDAAEQGVRWIDNAMSADFAVMADMNPGGDAVLTVKSTDPADRQRQANSRNHARDGQNVLYADCHVDWSASPWAGAQQDNIYTFHKEAGGNPAEQAPGGISGSPADRADSVMLPALEEKAATPSP